MTAAGYILAGWTPFVVILLLVLLLSAFYVRCYLTHRSNDLCSSLAAVFGVVSALLPCCLVPVDIFLASFMKEDGVFKEWAAEKSFRNEVETSVLIAYYVLYGLLLVFIFIILPFSYFFYEERNDGLDESFTFHSKICSAMKYTSVFILLAAVLFIIGAFVPFRPEPITNSTDSSEFDKIKNIIISVGKDRGETALSFVVGCLTTVGVLSIALYTASGMSIWPVNLIRGDTPTVAEPLESSTPRRSRIAAIRHPHNTEQLGCQQRVRTACKRRCAFLMRPFEIIAGVLFSLLGLLVFVTLLLVNIDKCLHSLGPKMSYALPEPQLPNPIDFVLVILQKVFPLDYIFMFGLTLYLFLCSMAGIKKIGIWFCWIRMYKIRMGQTKPQALLFLCFILMLIVMGLNLLLYQMAPQYMTYGSQQYFANSTVSSNATQVIKHCNLDATDDECVSTRISGIIFHFFYKFWFFGAISFWLMWAFIGMMLVAFVFALIKKRSLPDDDDDEGEVYSSDEELIH